MKLTCPQILSQTGQDPVLLSGDAPLRYRKDAIRVGKFVARNPLDGSELKLDVTPERIERWIHNFGRMRANGVQIDLTVDHKRGADAKRGGVIAMFRDGDVLKFDTDLADDEGEKLIKRCPEVSIEIEPDARDGSGNRYGEAITAISVCRQPVVSGQEPFQRIAASRGGESGGGSGTADLPVVWFSAHGQTTGNPANNDPLGSNRMFTDEQLAAIRKQHGLADDAKPEALAEKVMLSLGKVAAAETAATNLTEANDKITKLSQQVTDLEAKGKTLTLSRDVASMIEEGVDAKLGTLVEKGNITPACREKLAPLLKGGAVMLSREAAGEDAEKSRAVSILDALSENDPAAISKLLVEKTGGQTVQLSRQDASDDEDLDELEARTKKRFETANK